MRVNTENRIRYNPLTNIMIQEGGGKDKYEMIYTNPITHREFKSIMTKEDDVINLANYWKQRYRLLNDTYDKDYMDNHLIKVIKLNRGTEEYTLEEILAKGTDSLYEKGYLISEGIINLENGFISDINTYLMYEENNLMDLCLVTRRTHKSFTFKEQENVLKCKLTTPLRYCKTIVKKNYTDRLIKWCKKARVIHLSVYSNQVD